MGATRTARGVGTAVLALALAALLGEALWLRACGLFAMPEVNGDEAFYGLMAGRAVLGGKVPLLTYSGNVPDPFYPLMLAPLVAAFGPEFWVLRLPGLISGVLAVVVAYLLGRRAFDRPTGLALAVLVAVAPASVLYGGTGCEHAQSPLFGLIALACAFGARPLALGLAFLACLLVHPTNVFLLPALAGVYAASAWRRCEDAPGRRRLLLGLGAACGLVVAAVGVYAASRGVIGGGSAAPGAGRSLDWAAYLAGFGRFFSGTTYHLDAPSAEFVAGRDLGFWGLVALALLGLPRLVAERAWDRLALVGGLAVGVAALHVLAGPGVFGLGTLRYGVVFVAPTAVALAVLLAPRLRTRAADGPPRLRLVVAAPLLALASVPLADVRDHNLRYHAQLGGGSLAAPWKARGPLERAFARVADDLDARPRPRPPGKRVLVGQNWWFHKPLEYLALARPELRVVAYDRLGDDEATRQGRLRDLLARGAYAVGYLTQEPDLTVASSLDSAGLRRWTIDHGGAPVLGLTRLRQSDEDGPDRPPILATRPADPPPRR